MDYRKMIAALAVATTASMAMADIVSSSVVGYQNKDLKADYAFNLTVNTFRPVGKSGEQMTLGDITATDDWIAGTDALRTLKANGAVDKSYTFVPHADAVDWGCPSGWYLTADVADDTIEDLTPYCKNAEALPLGNGALILVGKASTKVIYAGEVPNKDQPIALKADYAFNITGNVMPADMTLGDITASDDWIAGTDALRTLKSSGAVDKSYTFVTPADAAEWGCPAGWYLTADVADDSIEDLTDYCKNATPVAAGEAFIVLVGKASTTITIPSVL